MRAAAPGQGRGRDRLRRGSGGHGPAVGGEGARRAPRGRPGRGLRQAAPPDRRSCARSSRPCPSPSRWAAGCGRWRTSSRARAAGRAGPSWAPGRRSIPTSSARCAAASRIGSSSGSTPRDGRVAVDGWKRVLDLEALALARDAAVGGGRGHHLHGHRARRHRDRAQSLEHRGRGPRGGHSRVRLRRRRAGLDDIRQLADDPRRRRCHRRPRALHRRVDLRQALAEAG